MSVKELKAIAEVGTTFSYSRDELKQYVNDEKMRMDKENEAEIQRKEKKRKPKKSVKWKKMKDGKNLTLRSLSE